MKEQNMARSYDKLKQENAELQNKLETIISDYDEAYQTLEEQVRGCAF